MPRDAPSLEMFKVGWEPDLVVGVPGKGGRGGTR